MGASQVCKCGWVSGRPWKLWARQWHEPVLLHICYWEWFGWAHGMFSMALLCPPRNSLYALSSLSKTLFSGHLGKWLLQKCAKSHGLVFLVDGFVVVFFICEMLFGCVIWKTLSHRIFGSSCTAVWKSGAVLNWTSTLCGPMFWLKAGTGFSQAHIKRSYFSTLPVWLHAFPWGILLNCFRKELHLELASEKDFLNFMFPVEPNSHYEHHSAFST